ncbi:uncharacterized protein EV420DRAFT_1763934 [Desarmillaria tabescens]|uniref:Uncharacterized protein n=1 Tax=Armillaria tabescens TaxID=1929756 RepID=A0AA39N649_ARMTA|nr:uncharacterized protein EV420DRAFT_1763934 [Desarmillaria tabescens]KAK0458868.1 hypothetical protein EV420DRAFT_1763934 [Desarmillaria tabescens]
MRLRDTPIFWCECFSRRVCTYGVGVDYQDDDVEPVYLGIVEYASGKPVIDIIPSQRQRRLTINLLLIHCAADDKADGFLNVEVTDIPVHLDHLQDEGLKETSKKGIGYSTRPWIKKTSRSSNVCLRMVLFKCFLDAAWLIPIASDMAIIMGVQDYEGKKHRYVNYLIVDVLRTKGLETMKRDLMFQQARRNF